jgi:hypothetical protein
MSGSTVNKNRRHLLLGVAILILILLSMFNVNNLFSLPQKVLGTETKIDQSADFWNDFLTKNPNYIPGLIETGDIDRAKQIDPNFQLDMER